MSAGQQNGGFPVKAFLIASATTALFAGGAWAQEQAKDQPPAKAGVGFYTIRDNPNLHRGGYGAYRGPYGPYYAPFYQGYYPGYGIGFYGYDWSPVCMRITNIDFHKAMPPAVDGKEKLGASTARGTVLTVKDWFDGRGFVDEQGRRWRLCSGLPVLDRPMALSGWLMRGEDNVLSFFTTSNQLFQLSSDLERAPQVNQRLERAIEKALQELTEKEKGK
jgi:hypothetical protein